jgi:Brinker DNA-binding domain
MSSDSENEHAPTPSKRKAYDLKFKLDAVEYAEKQDNSKAAQTSGVSRKRIREWKRQKTELLTQK